MLELKGKTGSVVWIDGRDRGFCHRAALSGWAEEGWRTCGKWKEPTARVAEAVKKIQGAGGRCQVYLSAAWQCRSLRDLRKCFDSLF